MTAIPKGTVLSDDATPQAIFTATEPTFVHAIQVSARADCEVTVDWTDDDNADAATDLCYNHPVTGGDASAPIAGGFALDTGDTIRARASVATTAHLTIVTEGQG